MKKASYCDVDARIQNAKNLDEETASNGYFGCLFCCLRLEAACMVEFVVLCN